MPFTPDQPGSTGKPTSGFVPDQQSQPPATLAEGFRKVAHYEPSEQEISDAMHHPVTGMEDPVYQAAGLVSPGGISVTGLGKMLRKGGDVLMQKALGATKVIPGLGEQFAKQGLIGTKSAMAGQTARGLEKSGQTISELAQKIPSKISLDPAANKIAALADTKMTSSGFIRPEDQPVVNKVLSKAQELAQSEPVSGAELAERRAIAGRSAREAGAYRTNPSSQLKSKVAQAEQAGYSEALKKAYSNAFPGAPEALADADKQYSVLSQADQLLNKPQSIGSLKDFLTSYTPSSLIESTAGRSAIGAGKMSQQAPIGAIPLSLQQLLKPRDGQ